MTQEEFDEAAHRLLQAEEEGSIRLPSGGGAGGLMGAMAAASAGPGGVGGVHVGGHHQWADEDEYVDETMPLRSPPARFTAPERQPTDGPQAPMRRGGRKGSSSGRRDTNV